MGIVYLSKQESLGRDCVLKLLNKGVTDDPSNAKRFKREAEMATKMASERGSDLRLRYFSGWLGVYRNGVHRWPPAEQGY